MQIAWGGDGEPLTFPISQENTLWCGFRNSRKRGKIEVGESAVLSWNWDLWHGTDQLILEPAGTQRNGCWLAGGGRSWVQGATQWSKFSSTGKEVWSLETTACGRGRAGRSFTRRGHVPSPLIQLLRLALFITLTVSCLRASPKTYWQRSFLCHNPSPLSSFHLIKWNRHPLYYQRPKHHSLILFLSPYSCNQLAIKLLFPTLCQLMTRLVNHTEASDNLSTI